MKRITLNEILPILGNDVVIKGKGDFYFDNVQTAQNINEQSLDWVNPIKKNKVDYIKSSKAPVILCELGLQKELAEITDKCLIFVPNPKLAFLRIAGVFFTSSPEYEIHPSAIIHKEAELASKCHIGPNSYIGKCKVGKGSIIYGNCYIYDNTVIGENVTIHAGTVIGAEGFGYQRNEKGEFERFPHIGGVIIENDVEIGSNTSIDRGALGDTIIETGVKIDNQVHIAHNVRIGKHSAVIANCMIGGSTLIGDYSWIAPSASLRDQITIGKSCTIGMGAVVTKSIPDDQTWTGSPAKNLEEFLELQKKLKAL
jgi:UDP-3-O-[3-hydroxymyristoyl] glucosamine N-acyltransferase